MILYLICAVLIVVYALMLVIGFFLKNIPESSHNSSSPSYVVTAAGEVKDYGAAGSEDPQKDKTAEGKGNPDGKAAEGEGTLDGGYVEGSGTAGDGYTRSFSKGYAGNDMEGKEPYSPDMEKKISDPPLREAPILKDAELLFGGNVYVSSYVEEAYDTGGGIEGVLSPAILSLSGEADFFMANQIFVLSERGEAYEGKEYVYRADPERVSILREAGIDGVSLANSHILDYGYEALTDTISALDGAGIDHTGAGENRAEAAGAVIKDINGMRTAFIGASRRVPDAMWGAGNERPGAFLCYDAEKERFFREIGLLNRSCDLVVAYIYWGDEGEKVPDYMRLLARETVEAGADLVVCSGVSGAGGVEYHEGTPIVYNLGDLMYGGGLREGYLLKVELRERENKMILSLYPVSSAMGYTRVEDDPQYYEFTGD